MLFVSHSVHPFSSSPPCFVFNSDFPPACEPFPSTLFVIYCTFTIVLSLVGKISEAFELTSVLNCLFSFSVAVKLKGLFVLFAGYLVKNCASLLDATNISKTGKRPVYLAFWILGQSAIDTIIHLFPKWLSI